MINIILSGCNGRMGQVITRLAADDDNIGITAGFDINDKIANLYPVFRTPSECTEKADVLIDFSHPSAFSDVLAFCLESNTPAVICTTGLSAEQRDTLKKESKNIPIFFSANMSLGINLLTALAKKAAKLLADGYDIEIVERHHNQKVDAPSGTALAIADGVSGVLDTAPEYVYDRHNVRRKRRKNEIGIHSVRGGTIVGDHEIIFAGTDEVIELRHSAQSKEVFAVGALKAAKFLTGKPNGLYSMDDLVANI